MKILIGVDDSRFNQAAVASVAQRRWENGTPVKIVSALENHLYNDLSRERNRYESRVKPLIAPSKYCARGKIILSRVAKSSQVLPKK